MIVPRRRSLWPESAEQEASRRFEAGEGTGPWNWHLANRENKRERQVQALMRGIGFAVEQGRDVSPWQALQEELNRCVHRIRWYETQLARVTQNAEDVLPNGVAFRWIVMQAEERKNLRETAKIAVAAGLSAALVRQIETEAEVMFLAARAALDVLDISQADKERVLEAMADKMAELADQYDSMPALTAIEEIR